MNTEKPGGPADWIYKQLNHESTQRQKPTHPNRQQPNAQSTTAVQLPQSGRLSKSF
jgi:hypothetical protein